MKLAFRFPGFRPRAVFLYAAAFVLYVHLVFALATSTIIIAYRWIDPPLTGIMVYRKVRYGWDLTERRKIPLAKIPKTFRNMVVRVEDGSFYTHKGILLAAFKNAARLNKQLGSPTYGGSTITMQTARTLFLNPEKSYLRKYLEVIIALEMELFLSKDRILELYLNNAEWGKGVFGIEAASVHHYGKSVTRISNDQAMRLVTILSSPILYSPYTVAKSAILRSRYSYLVKRFP